MESQQKKKKVMSDRRGNTNRTLGELKGTDAGGRRGEDVLHLKTKRAGEAVSLSTLFCSFKAVY